MSFRISEQSILILLYEKKELWQDLNKQVCMGKLSLLKSVFFEMNFSFH